MNSDFESWLALLNSYLFLTRVQHHLKSQYLLSSLSTDAHALVQKYRAANLDDVFAKVERFWDDTLGAIDGRPCPSE